MAMKVTGMCELEADIAKANNGAQGSARQFKEEYIMVVQHNLTAMNSNRMLGLTLLLRQSLLRNSLPDTRSTEQQMMQLAFPSVRK